jgi:putative ABC transport system permease protein
VTWHRFFERDRRDEELARELEAHLAHEVDDLVARGVPEGEARMRAARKLGNATVVRETVYEHNSLVTLEALFKDVRHALRRLRRQPLFTAVAVLSLALGIGANTAIFSLLDQALWRPLPVKDPEALVLLYHPGPLEGHSTSDEPGGPAFSYPLFRGLRETQTPFTALAGARPLIVNLVRDGRAMTARAHRVSGSYFDLLGVRAALGRVITEDDDRTPGAHPVVVLGHRYWTNAFGGDTGVLNRTLSVNGVAMTIVGVASAGFFGEGRGVGPDLFVPLSMNDALEPERKSYDNRKYHWIPLIGRLKPGVTRAAAAAAADVAYRVELEKDLSELDIGKDEEAVYRAKHIVLKPGGAGRGGGSALAESQARLLLLPGITLLVLFIACANIANLQLSRATARAREVFLRVALGASRAALVRQFLTESALLAALGGAVGLLLARWMVPAVGARLSVAAVGPLSNALDGRVLLFALAASAFTVVACGLYPALRASRPDLAAALKDESAQAGAPRGARVFRLSLVTGQLALSLVLVIMAGLLSKTLVNLTRVELGFEPDRLVTFRIEPDARRYDRERAAAFLEQVRERAAGIPGVRAAVSTAAPIVAGSVSSGSLTVEVFTPPGRAASANVAYNAVGPGYFGTMAVPILAGREFTPDDGPDAPRVAIVSEAFARRFFGTRDPIGRRLGSGMGDGVKLDTAIVGVARDAKYHFLREEPAPFYYLSYAQRQPRRAQLYLRTAVTPEAVFAAVQREVAAVDPQVPVQRLKTMRRQLDDNLAGERGVSLLAVGFGALATVLAALGLYGVLAYSVALRTREIGIRIALGAGAREVRALLGREIVPVLGVGGVIGLAGAAAAARSLQVMLYGVQPWDPTVYASAAALLFLIVLAAAYVPARRAARIDPAIALRQD